MKILIMCEGPNELEVVKILLENDCFIFNEDDLLNLTPFHARQIKSSAAVKTALNIYPENDVVVYSFYCPHCENPYIDYKKEHIKHSEPPYMKFFGLPGCVHLGHTPYTDE